METPDDAHEGTYNIVRFYAPGQPKQREVVQEGVTYAEAIAHCNDPNIKKTDEYFDGFVRQ